MLDADGTAVCDQIFPKRIESMSLNMRPNTSPTVIAFGLKTLSAAVASAIVLLSSAQAAGLGKLTVLSALGQPLRAEIELNSISKEETGALVAKLASQDAFRKANVDFNPALMSLRFSVEQRGSRQYIKVSSTQAINDPFVDMLLELSANNNRMVREYTFLLDPAELRTGPAAQVAAAPVNTAPAATAPAARPVVSAAGSSDASAPAPTGNTRQAVRAAAKAASDAKGSSETKAAASGTDYQVKQGDTLAGIANQLKPEGVSLDQMLVGLYRANPSAFAGNNMNRLRSGQVLSMTEAEAIARGIREGEAKSVVVAQAADFNEYRHKLAGQVAAMAPTKSEEDKQSASGKIGAKVEERATAANEAKDKLKLSKAGAAPAASDKATGAATSAEDKIAKDRATSDANARVKELEKNVTDLQKLLEVKDKNLATQQKQADTAANGKPGATTAAAPAESAPAPASAAAPAVNAGASTPAASSVASEPPVIAAAPVEAAKPKTAPAKPKRPLPPPPEPSFIDENSGILAGVAGLLAVLGGILFYNQRRKKKDAEAYGVTSMLGDSSSLTANSLFGSTGGQSVDTNNSVFNSNFAPSASQLDANEVDPVAEADVYIAYGRDAQAEEILKEALRTQPERNAVRVKLLEIYANRKDLRAFDLQASELYGMTKGEGDDWLRAAGMGMAIDPNNPLYAGGELPEEAARKTATLHSATEPLEELDPEALLTNSLHPTTAANLLDDDLAFAPTKAPAGASMPAKSASHPTPTADIAQAAKEKAGQPAGGGSARFTAAEVPSLPAIEPVKAQSTSQAPAAGSIDFGDLDFDLGEISAPKAVPLPSAAAAPAPKAAFDDLSFDLGEAAPKLPTIDTPAPAATAQNAVATATKPAPATSLDFDPILAFQPIHQKSAVIAAVTGATAAVAAAAAAAKSDDGMAAPVASMEFDLSDINLDLDPAHAKHEPVAEAPVAHATSSAAQGVAHAATSDSASAEMATKLDLAVAYQEIGDKDGARELLDEVLQGGTPEQVDRARAMRVKLG